MSLAVVGTSHHTAPVAVRERFAFAGDDVEPALREVVDATGADEAVLLSTCNRTELYLYPAVGVHAFAAVERFLQRKAGPLPAPVSDFLYTYRGTATARHLFRVTSGLDSLVTGEAEIQGQVRDAYERVAATEPPLAGPILHRLFQTALQVGGRVRAETAVAEGAASVASVAVELARKIFGRIEGRRVLVLGAGEASRLVVEALGREGASGAVVANRTYDRAADLAEKLRGRAVQLDEIHRALPEVDIVVASTGAPHAILTPRTLEQAFPGGLGRPLLLIDIAVPRDVAPEVAEDSRVFLYNVDDLRQIVDETIDRRRDALREAETLVRQHVGDFAEWYGGREVVPVVRALRARGDAARNAEVERLLARLESRGGIDPDQRAEIEAFSRRLLNKLLHEPTVGLKRGAAEGRAREALDAYRLLYGEGGTPLDEAERPHGTDAGPDDDA